MMKDVVEEVPDDVDIVVHLGGAAKVPVVGYAGGTVYIYEHDRSRKRVVNDA